MAPAQDPQHGPVERRAVAEVHTDQAHDVRSIPFGDVLTEFGL